MSEEIRWHLQDWLLAVEALASETHPDDPSPAAERRWRLIESICQQCGIDPAEYVFEIDDDWGPQQATSVADQPASTVSVSVDADDAQQLANALSTLAGRETETARTRRAGQLVEADERLLDVIDSPCYR